MPTRSRRPKGNSKTQKPGISTAKLQALLPRRRLRANNEDRDEFEADSSEEIPGDSEEDELQMPTSRLRHKASKSKQKTVKRPNAIVRRSRRTYGRPASSDKENESSHVGNPSLVEEEAPVPLPRSQMAAIAKRFEDVDAWEMDFESIDVTGGSSSPWR